MMTIVAPHRIPLRELKLRVVLRSSHGIARTTSRKSVGIAIVEISSVEIESPAILNSGGNSASSPKSDKKYHAGYGTKNFVGSAFSSRNGGKNEREQDDDHEDDERRGAVHEHLIRPEAPDFEFARIVDDRTGRAVVTEDREMRADQADERRRHQPHVQAEEAVDRRGSHRAAALRDVLNDRRRRAEAR